MRQLIGGMLLILAAVFAAFAVNRYHQPAPVAPAPSLSEGAPAPAPAAQGTDWLLVGQIIGAIGSALAGLIQLCRDLWRVLRPATPVVLIVVGLAILSGQEVTAQQGSSLPCVTKEPRLPDGTEVDIDLPEERELKNTGGSDGAGLCVGTSIEMSLDWHHVHGYPGKYQQWLTRFPGGSWPEKAAQQLKQYASANNLKAPEILQSTNGDLELLVAAVKNGYHPAITYSKSPTGRYGGQRISHMVNLRAARAGPQKAWCIKDNNYPGYEWMTESQFKAIHDGWSVIVLNQPDPPPVPRPNK
ncbi:MAG TPA: hypothetical protein PLN21_09255 [Gemmatales bacterium]|nr:hypothetical protein [Gemmatales bacterium]